MIAQTTLFKYSPLVQAQALTEIKILPPAPCARDVPVEPCSATRRMMMDYGTNRKEQRAAGFKESP